ncbi:MAG: hypothetical protein HQL32_03390 [Planctomycetes bacterium]|nr:hypothetical protein [Planctomycetota bacterium]
MLKRIEACYGILKMKSLVIAFIFFSVWALCGCGEGNKDRPGDKSLSEIQQGPESSDIRGDRVDDTSNHQKLLTGSKHSSNPHALFVPGNSFTQSDILEQKEYLNKVQALYPAAELGQDWTRNLIVNGDFGADLFEWEKINSSGISLEKGTFSYQACSLRSKSVLTQNFSERLDDFLFVSKGKVGENTGILFRIQGYIKGGANSKLKLAIHFTDSKGTREVSKSITFTPEYRAFSHNLMLNYKGKISDAYLSLSREDSPSQSTSIEFERLELRALAPIAKDIDLGEEYPRWMTFRNGTDLRVSDALANGRVKITHALRSEVVKTLKNYEPTKNMLHVDHENYMLLSDEYYEICGWGLAGKVLTEITKETKSIKVALPENKSAKTKFFRQSGDTRVLFTLGKNGKPDRTKTEVVYIEKVVAESKKSTNSMFTIKRDVLNRGIQSFPANKTYMGTIQKSYYNPDNLLRTSKGESLIDVYLSKYTDRYKEVPYRGLEFDTGSWYYLGDADLDFDFRADGGIFNGVSTGALGAVEAIKGLREALGNDFILQCDGSYPNINDGVCKVGYKSFEWINGIEKESYISRNSSTVFEHFRHAQELVRFNPVFNYALNKDVTARYNSADSRKKGATDKVFLSTLAASCVLGMVQSFHPDFNELDDIPDYGKFYKWDEYNGGDLDNQSWLGKPIGPMMQYLANVDRSKNLLGESQWVLSHEGVHSGQDFAIDFEEVQEAPNSFKISLNKIPDGYMAPNDIMVKAKKELPKGRMRNGHVYTWSFLARATDYSELNGRIYKNIPKQVYFGLAPGEADAGAVLVSGAWRHYTISFMARADKVSSKEFPNRHVDTRWIKPKKKGQIKSKEEFAKEELLYQEYKKGPHVFQPTLSFGSQNGSIEIRNLELYKGDDACWYREFENGLVLHHTGSTPWKVIIPQGYQRLKTANEQPYNTGEEMSGKAVVLGTGESLFLVKKDAYAKLRKLASSSPKTSHKPRYWQYQRKEGTSKQLSQAESDDIRVGKIAKKGKKKKRK